jgi:hypothetical protein
MNKGYPESCRNCTVYTEMVIKTQIECAIAKSKREVCPCPKCLVFLMCGRACNKFIRKRGASLFSVSRI